MSHVYLTVAEVVKIHEEAINRFGGSQGILNEGALDSALGRLRSGYYENIFEESTALFESLATNHAFIDGNKRVAFFATDAFLYLNGYFIDCDDDEADRFIRSMLVTNSSRFKKIYSWLEESIRKMPENENL